MRFSPCNTTAKWRTFSNRFPKHSPFVIGQTKQLGLPQTHTIDWVTVALLGYVYPIDFHWKCLTVNVICTESKTFLEHFTLTPQWAIKMCQETQAPSCDFQCLRSQQVYLEIKRIQQTQWHPIGRADRCSLSQTCYKYKNVSLRLLEYSECLERRHTVVCQRLLG